MTLNAEQKAEIWHHYDTWMTGYLNADVETYDTYFDDDYHFIGSTNNEEFLNRKDTTKFFELTGEQFAGITALRNETKILDAFGTSVFLTHIFDGWFLHDKEWTYYGRFRFSSVMQKKEAGWRFIYQHFSMPDLKSDEGQTIGYENITAENFELKEAIKRRTIELEVKNKELEIEAALERVRSRSLAMHKSDELNDVVSVVFEKFKELQIPFTAVGIAIGIEGSKDLNSFVCGENEAGLVITNYRLPYFDHIIAKDFNNVLEKQLDFFVGHYSKEEKDAFYEYVIEHTAEFRHLPADVKRMVFESTTYTVSMVAVKNALFAINDFEGKLLVEGEIDIIKRFARVFDQAYTRFLDLQKAEAQAKEAQIEVALEKVRSRTMAMQSSAELGAVAAELFAQMNQLVTNLWTCGFVLCEKDRDEDEWWLSMDGDFTRGFFLPNVGDYAHATLYEGWLKGEPLRAVQLDGVALQQHYDWLMDIPVSRAIFEEMDAAGLARPDWQKLHAAYFSRGYLVLITREPCGEEEIFRRFAQVFDQTYTRFLDLQKAEAQTREAQVNLAVERVRAKALAMFKSEEILQVVHKLKDEIMGLNIPNVAAATIHLKEPDGMCRIWDLTSFEIGDDGLHLPLDIRYRLEDTHPDFFMRRVWENDAEYFVVMQEDANFKHTLQWLRDNGLHEQANETEAFFKSTQLKKVYHPTVPLNNGRMCIDLLDSPSPEVASILTKMAGAFDLAYKRFEDLQKAEAQTREAQIQLALERVRAKTMAMKTQSDLLGVIELFGSQLLSLGVRVEHSSFINGTITKNRDWELWGYSPMSDEPPKKVIIPYIETPYFTKTAKNIDEFERTGNPIQVKSFTKEETGAFFAHYWKFDPPATDEAKNFLSATPGSMIIDAFLEEVTVSIVKFEKEPYSEEQIDIFKRFSNEFRQTYIRFLDLQKAEAQAKEAQIELSLERIRSQVTAMQESSDLLDIVVTMRTEFVKLGHEAHYFWHMRWLPERYDKAMTSGDGTKIGMVMTLPRHIHGDIPLVADWEKTKEPTVVLAMDVETAVDYVEKMITLGDFEQVDPQAPTLDDIRHIGGLTFVMARTTHGEIGYSLPGVVSDPPKDAVVTLVRFAGVFDLAYKRFEDLKAAEKQHWEAQIELALERVRARTMAMQHSDELADASQVLDQQVRALGIETWGCAFHIYADNAEGDYEWFSSSNGNLPFYKTPREKFFLKFYEKGQQGEKFHVEEFKGEDCKIHYDFLKTIPVAGDALRALEASGIPLPTYQIDHIAFYQHGYILFITYKPVPEAHDIFQRFAKVFEQTYTRFLDLQKAEGQAREAQIEAALERVRSSTMGMQRSEDMAQTASEMFRQILTLGMQPWGCGFNIFDKDEKAVTQYMSLADGGISPPFRTPLTEDPFFISIYDARQRKDDLLVMESSGESLAKTYRYMFSLPGSGEIFGDLEHSGFEMPKYQITHCAYFSQGYLVFITYELVPEAHDIFKRFAKVFEQTYTRFLDLKKAEAQAREAKIEVALERTRTQSMLMQHSGELNEISKTFHEQLLQLGIDSEFSFVWLPDEEKNEHMFWATWVSDEDGVHQYHTRAINYPLDKTEPGTAACYVAWESSEPVHETFVPPGEVDSFFAAWEELLTGAEKIRPEFFPDGIYYTEAYMKYGCFGIDIRRRLDADEKEIIRRFAVEFERTYTRFLDLKKAEAQAMEAIKRASVDRVRAEIASMRTTSDLERIQPLIWNELTTLGVPFIRCGVFILMEEKREVQAFLSTPDGKSIAAFHLPYDATEQTKQIVAHWQQKQLFKDHMDEKAFAEYTQNLVQQGAMASDEKYVTENRPTDLYLHFLPFLQGMMYVGNNAPLNEDELQLVQNLADAFSTAYARYEDFNKLEAAKAEVESAMRELKATQSQLVQQEKLASLGQLTAGIAHEIKNPLNFVNNFTEVSIELIEEALEEMLKHEDEKDTSLINHNLDDIKSNLKKVHDHGTRANSIVNSMLMHSRGGGGLPEPTLLNGFIREYCNLAFHGMRAGSNPLDVQIIFNLDERVKEVPLIVEDFSRVVLNICNNAFDAMRRTQRPTLTIHTQLQKDAVLIQFEDNGPGIPDEIKDKILQPFFTTKKGTEGTGLGLSISNDIVKAHGGELKVEALPAQAAAQAGKEGEGCMFSIVLPI